MALDKKHIQSHLEKTLSKFPSEKYIEAISAHLLYCAENYAELTPEAKSIVDKQFKLVEQINDTAFEKVAEQPDSLEKRKLIRLYRKTKNSHFDLKQLIDSLSKTDGRSIPIVNPGEKLFLDITQKILDYLCDITEGTLQSKDLVFLGLFYGAVEELYISFFLAKQGYAPQSMSHTRHVLESLDLLTLFEDYPDYIDLWASDDWKKKNAELSPGRVREKLGKDSYDPIYSLLSELGSHATFKYIQMKVGVRIVTQPSAAKRGKMKARINIGGVPAESEFHVMQSIVACILSSISTLTTLINIYENLLLQEEVNELKPIIERFKSFMSEHYEPLGEDFGVDLPNFK